MSLSIRVQLAAAYLLYLSYTGEQKKHYELVFGAEDLHEWSITMMEEQIKLANSIIEEKGINDYYVLDVDMANLCELHERGLKGAAWPQ